jgi:hypothetical protein
MPSLQNTELLPKCEVSENEVPTAFKSADECPEPEGRRVEHGPELLSDRGRKSCSKPLIWVDQSFGDGQGLCRIT